MPLEKRIFTTGMNDDDEERIIPPSSYRYALNIRNSKSDSDSQGAIENVKGNIVCYYDFLVNGIYKCIGAYDDNLNNKIYWFVWSDVGNHLILEYSVVNNTVAAVIFGTALNFQKDKLIVEQNVAIIDGLMYWLNVKPYKINIEKAKAGQINGFNEQDLLAVKKSPTYPPTVIFETDSTKKQNSVRGKLFQFRYQWVYDDSEESAWSPISKVATPLNEGQFRPNGYYPTEINNNIRVDIDLGSSLVKRVRIAFRESNIGDFYLFRDIDKSLTPPPLTTSLSYNFFNDEVYIPLDNNGNKGMRLFDWMPLTANAQALIDGNRIAYGGITEGYDPVNIDIDITQVTGVLPKLPPPKATVTINNQWAYGNMYGVNVGDFKTYFTEGREVTNTFTTYNPFPNTYTQPNPYFTYYKIVDNTQNVQWYREWINNWSGIGGYNYAKLYNLTEKKDSTGAWGNDDPNIWVTDVHTLEVILDNNLGASISEGARVIIKIKAEWYNFKSLTTNYRIFTLQETAVNGDTANSVLSRFRTQINTLTYIDPFVEISFSSSVGGWSRGLNSNVGSNSAVLGVQIKGIVPTDKVVVMDFLDRFMTNESGFPCLINTQTIGIQTLADWTAKSEKTLKMGAKHGIGIVYKDYAGRSGLTNTETEKNFYVKFPTERLIPNDFITDVISLKVSVNHKAPLWADTWQIVYTGNQTIEKTDGILGYKGFIQIRLDAVIQDPYISNAYRSSITFITTYNDSTAENLFLGYGFSKGDRIRFLKDSNDNYYQEYIDVEIISYSAGQQLVFKKPSVVISGSPVVEIYSPKKENTNEFYYEVGEVYKCVDGLHYGDINQVEDINGIITTPATVTLDDIGDVYLRFRTSPMNTQVEDYGYSDFYKSDSWDKGRPNIVDNNIKQIYRPSTIRYSQPYIPETNINGLSRFDDFDFEVYERLYGDIRLLYPSDRLLNVFQRLKVGRVGVSQSVIYSADGTSAAVSRVNKVLNEIVYYAGEYGIGDNPESFAVYGNAKYFVDVKRGVVCRLGADGITTISEYKMHNYFNDIFNALDTNSLPYKVIGTYDVRFDEYIIHITNGIIQETLSFSEGKNRWVSFYSYYPEYMISNRIGLISFNKGQLYRHNENMLYDNFYGLTYSSKIKFLCNLDPNKIKVFTTITEDATEVWDMSEATNQNGQKTSLIADDFDDVEGVYKAALLKDENTPNVAVPLIEGDEIRGHSLTITLENDSTGFVKLFSVGVGVTLSELTNR